jgi:hypothetical protein
MYRNGEQHNKQAAADIDMHRNTKQMKSTDTDRKTEFQNELV